MLKVDCPKCTSSMTSPALIEAEEMRCSVCGEDFPVKDIYIVAWPYTIYREVALKNVDKYMRLLRETKADVAVMEKLGKDSMPYRESAKSLNQFIEMLTELLDGCSGNLRVPGGATTVEFYAENTPIIGSVKNISSTGICITLPKKFPQLGPGRIIKLSLKDRALSEPLSLKAWVVWSTLKGITGLKFVGIDNAARIALGEFIKIKSSMTEIEAAK
ncbi:MAG: PilZ domain-containing protein [Thermodesulfobacteriota bacterium]